MVIHDDQIGLGGALVHGRDEAAIEFRTFRSGASVAPGVEALPQIRIVGQKIQLRAVARVRHFLPVADLMEPVQLVEALQLRLVGHPVHFLPAQEIAASLHHGDFQLRREMLLQKRDVLLE